MNEKVSLIIIKGMQDRVDGVVKAWCKLPSTASVKLLTLPYERYGLNLPNFEKIYAKFVCMKYNYLTGEVDLQTDSIVKFSLGETIRARKCSQTPDFFGRERVNIDPIRTFWTVAHEVAKKYGCLSGLVVAEGIDKQIYDRAKSSLELQGELFRAWEAAMCDNVSSVKRWLRIVGDESLKFYVKASLQLLYTPAYRKYAGGGGNGECKCGGNKKGTQKHYLAACPMTVDYRVRRHNRVQNTLLAARPKNPDEIIFVDAPVIPHFYRGTNISNNKPDAFIINHKARTLTIIEFAVPYDSNIHKALETKIQKYAPLITAIKTNYPLYSVKLIPIVVGALGGMMKEMVDLLVMTGIEKMRSIRDVMMRMRKCAITGSMDVWNRRHCDRLPQFYVDYNNHADV